MRFIETWLPLLAIVREGGLDRPEMDQLSKALDRHLARGAPFAVLSLAELQAPLVDALGRQRFAEWARQPGVQRSSKEWCAGVATVVAREADRRAMTALLWLWTPVAPHEVVDTVARGLDFCLDCLVERKVPLPAPREAFRSDISRGLAALSVAGLVDEGGVRATARPRAPSGARRVEQLEKITHENGYVVIGWVKRGVLWASFHGHLSAGLGEIYAERLKWLVRQAKGTSYFIDASRLDSFDLVGRTVALRALIENRHRFASVRILNWSGGVSSTGRAMLQGLGELVQTTEERAGFERILSVVAPGALETIAAFGSDGAVSAGEPSPKHR